MTTGHENGHLPRVSGAQGACRAGLSPTPTGGTSWPSSRGQSLNAFSLSNSIQGAAMLPYATSGAAPGEQVSRGSARKPSFALNDVTKGGQGNPVNQRQNSVNERAIHPVGKAEVEAHLLKLLDKKPADIDAYTGDNSLKPSPPKRIVRRDSRWDRSSISGSHRDVLGQPLLSPPSTPHTDSPRAKAAGARSIASSNRSSSRDLRGPRATASIASRQFLEHVLLPPSQCDSTPAWKEELVGRVKRRAEARDRPVSAAPLLSTPATARAASRSHFSPLQQHYLLKARCASHAGTVRQTCALLGQAELLHAHS
eukprot:6213749-Pleurochrysis_carterae.AAC.5